jgi:hypothetical protein
MQPSARQPLGLRTMRGAVMGCTLAALFFLAGSSAPGPARADIWGQTSSALQVTPFARPAPKSLGAQLNQIHLTSPGRTHAEVLSIFKLQLSLLAPAHWQWARKLLQPYVLGGTADQAVPTGRNIGNSIPGETTARALQFGAGTELRLNGELTLSLDFSEVQQRGEIGEEHNRTYRLGFRYDF